MKMEEHESVSDFSSQLSELAQEARVLGMEYKDKKLVKKFKGVCQKDLQVIRQQCLCLLT